MTFTRKLRREAGIKLMSLSLLVFGISLAAIYVLQVYTDGFLALIFDAFVKACDKKILATYRLLLIVLFLKSTD